MRSNESSEDYLETILILGNRSSLVRAVDIAAEMGFKKPSVSVAMKNLRQKNLITVADNGDIRLTEEGHKIADKVYERHQLISSWLIMLGVQEKTALHDACRIEHIISEESFEALKKAVHELREQENAAKEKAVSEAGTDEKKTTGIDNRKNKNIMEIQVIKWRTQKDEITFYTTWRPGLYNRFPDREGLERGGISFRKDRCA